MWKRLSIFLVVFLLAVSSLWCYPSWVYGRGKTTEVTTVQEPAEVVTETETTTPDPVEEKSTEPETPESSLTAGSSSLSEALREQGESLTNSLTESKVKAAAVTQASEYIDNAVLGVEIMEQAYNLEVAAHEDIEAKYNAIANKRFEKDFYITINPFVTYSPLANGWGLGLNTVYTYKGIGISLGAYKPNLDFQTFEDISVSAGVAFIF